MKYNILIDLGNIWEALSAIGTISAVIISLWLAFPSKFQIGKIILQGVDEPLHLIHLQGAKRYIGFDFQNNSDFEYQINSVNILIKPKFSFKNYFNKNRINYKSEYNYFIKNSMEQFGRQPFKVKPRDLGNLYYEYNIFLNDVLKDSKSEECMFYVKTNTGKIFYSKKFILKNEKL